MEWINDIIKIIIANKIIVTWIVIGWLLLVFFFIEKIHKKPVWKDAVRGIGEGVLGSMWMIMCVVVLHFVPGLAIMLVVVFSFYHWRRWVDDKRNGPTAPRNAVGFFVMLILAGGLWLYWYIGYDPVSQLKRGVAQLTSYTVFADARNSASRLRGTGVRPSEPTPINAEADTSSWPIRFFGKSTSDTTAQKQNPARSK
jgi:hypothetical protein